MSARPRPVPPPFDPQPRLLGPSLSLRPLRAEDFEPLVAVASDPELWAQHPDPQRAEPEIFRQRFFEPGLASGGALLICERRTGAVIGSSRYYDWDPQSEEVAIGYTFLARSHWGSGANGELKALMLRYAFRWAQAVWFHVGAENLRSRKAVEKLGAELVRMVPTPVNGQLVDYCHYRLRPSEARYAGGGQTVGA